MKPRNARTIKNVFALRTDNIGTKRSWLSIDATTITIQELSAYGVPTITVVLPRKTFDRFINWYNKDQRPNKK